MNLRRIIKHPIVQMHRLKLSLLLVLTCVMLIVWSYAGVSTLAGRTNPSQLHYQKWFYDMNTGKLFAADTNLHAPIKAPSGIPYAGEPAGMSVFVYGCGSCQSPSEQKIGYLFKHSPAFLKQMELEQLDDEEKLESFNDWVQVQKKFTGKYYRTIKGSQWHRAGTAQARCILAQPAENCGSQNVVPCPVRP